MSLEENKALVRRLNHEAFDLGDLEAPARYLASDFLNHVSGQRGVEDFQRIIRMIRAAFPDGQITVDQEVAEGDLVMQVLTSTGTHLGEFRMPWGTIPPTGKPVSWQSVRIYRVVDGKITEHWAVRDDLTLLMQLGFRPAPAQA
jgi:predicted ester cyclase